MRSFHSVVRRILLPAGFHIWQLQLITLINHVLGDLCRGEPRIFQEVTLLGDYGKQRLSFVKPIGCSLPTRSRDISENAKRDGWYPYVLHSVVKGRGTIFQQIESGSCSEIGRYWNSVLPAARWLPLSLRPHYQSL
jgi:hypothetical protein